MNTYFGKNLKFLRERKGLEQLELAQLLGRKSASSVSEWEKGTYTPKSGVLSDIAQIFNVSLSDLMNVDLTMPTNLKEIAPASIRIPILGKIACGNPITAEENIEGYLYKSPEGLPKGELISLQVKGDSMSPTIPNGAYVIIRCQNEAENGELVAVRINGDEDATLKRLKKQGDTIILMPDNPKYEPLIVDEENPVTIIGKAVSYEVKL